MATGSISAASLLQQGAASNLAQFQAAGKAGAQGAAPAVGAPKGPQDAAQAQQGVAAPQDAAQGAAQAQQPQEEPFNAPRMKLAPDATTSDVLVSLSKAMGNPNINKSTAQQLYQLQQQLFEAHKATIRLWTS